MKTFKAKLLKDLTYISGCTLKKGSLVKITESNNRTTWVIDVKANQLIRVFNHDFETV